MTTLTPDSTPRSNTSNALLDQCGVVNAEIDGIEPSLEQLRILQHRALNDADNFSSSATNQQLDALSSETLVLYRELIKRVCTIKSNPEANDPKYKPQVDRVDRRLKQAIQKYQQVDSGFRKPPRTRWPVNTALSAPMPRSRKFALLPQLFGSPVDKNDEECRY
ncbi:hypothetical protein ACQRIT_002379 [Beauveria bassiana]